MKHLINSPPHLLQVKGFRHGAGGESMDPEHLEEPDYNRGYGDGQKAKAAYIEDLCRNNDLINPKIQNCGNEEALQRERKPERERELKDLADHLGQLAVNAPDPSHQKLHEAARQLRLMAGLLAAIDAVLKL